MITDNLNPTNIQFVVKKLKNNNTNCDSVKYIHKSQIRVLLKRVEFLTCSINAITR